MATAAQLRKIEVMWFNISRQTNDADREKALTVMLQKITGKSHLRFLTHNDVSKMIKALNAMKKDKE